MLAIGEDDAGKDATVASRFAAAASSSSSESDRHGALCSTEDVLDADGLPTLGLETLCGAASDDDDPLADSDGRLLIKNACGALREIGF
jgi:hypothetical protein